MGIGAGRYNTLALDDTGVLHAHIRTYSHMHILTYSHTHILTQSATRVCCVCCAGKRIVGISAGRYNTLAVDDTGVLHAHIRTYSHTHILTYSHTHIITQSATRVRCVCCAGKRIVGISAGRYNTLALDDTGVLHAWGLDGCGSEGRVPAREQAWVPRPVGGGLVGQQVKAFDSGVCGGVGVGVGVCACKYECVWA